MFMYNKLYNNIHCQGRGFKLSITMPGYYQGSSNINKINWLVNCNFFP